MDQEMKLQVREVLASAKARIAEQSDLGKGEAVHRDSNGKFIPWTAGVPLGSNDCTCAGLAIYDAWFEKTDYQSPVQNEAYRIFTEANGIPLGEWDLGLAAIAEWNDEPDRTKEDVLDAFDNALAHDSLALDP